MVQASETGFLADIEPIKELWRIIDLRILAMRDPAVGWRCDGLRAVLSAEESIVFRKDLPIHGGLLSIHAAWPIDRLDDLVHMVDVGEIVVERETVTAKQLAGQDQWRPISTHSLRTYDRADSRARFGLDWRTVVLQGYDTFGGAENWRRSRETLDAELRVGDSPWNGMADLRHSFLGQPVDDATRIDIAQIEIVAPILVRFGLKSTLTESSLRLHAEAAPTAEGKEVVAGIFIARGDETVSRKRVAFDRGDRRFPREGVQRRVKLPPEFSGIDCTLAYRGRLADRLMQYGPASGRERIHWGIFGATVGGPGDLIEALLSDASGGDPFEHAVATLFNLLGFTTWHYGSRTFARGGDLPDMIACPPARDWILVVEATTRDLDYSAVVSRLVTRTKEIQGALPKHEAQAVLIVRQPRATVLATAREVATRERVAIVTMDELRDLVGLAIANMPQDKVRDFLAGLIPYESRWNI